MDLNPSLPQYSTHYPLSTRQLVIESLIGLVKALTIIGSLFIVFYFLLQYLPFFQRSAITIRSQEPQQPFQSFATVAYTPVKYTDLGSNPTPLITAPLSYNGHRENLTFLLDSGALITAIPISYAHKYDVDLNQLKRILLATLTQETVFGYIADMELYLGEQPLQLPVAFATVHSPVLGRHGLLDHYTLLFNHQDQSVTFSTTPVKN